MSEQSLNRDTALRIALAARAIPDMSVPAMLDLLQEMISSPLTLKSLKGVTESELAKAIAATELENVNPEDLKQAVKALWGESGESATLEPEDNSVPLDNAIRVAIASNEGEILNGHFGSCVRFLVYDLSAEDLRLVDIRSTVGAEAEEDKNAYRTGLISDCDVVYMISIGGPAAAKVIRSGIYPIKQKSTVPAREALSKLQEVMAGSPPPWLAKILGQDAEARVRFSRDEEELGEEVV